MKKSIVNTETNNVVFSVAPGGSLSGTIRVPGDKSISHRSIMLGSLAEGITTVTGFLQGEDNFATLNAFRAMGVAIDDSDKDRIIIHGVGLHGLCQPEGDLYLGNSGTSIRLLSGILSGQKFASTMAGDKSLSTRPMARVMNPLREMGANIHGTEKNTPPLHVEPAENLQGIEYVMPMASAQVKSCLLLAGLYAKGRTCVTEPAPTRDHTERMLRGFGYQVERQGSTVCLEGGGKLTATDVQVPADISSATFFIVGACIAEGSDITLTHVGINPTRIGVLNILKQMGANIDILNERDICGEPVADIRVRYSELRGISIPEEQVPLAIDEFPAIFVAAACAQGETVLTGAEELRVKESDRIQVMADGLQVLGVDARPTPDGIIIQGGRIRAGEVHSHGDHRIAMSFTMAGLRASGAITIHDCANVNTSFPGFAELAQRTGCRITHN